MADERDRLRRQLGLAPLPTAGRTDSAASVDERTQAKAKTLTPDQVRAAPSGTRYKTTDGRELTKP